MDDPLYAGQLRAPVLMMLSDLSANDVFSDLAIAQAHIICEYGVSSEKGETTWRKASQN